MMYAYCRRWKQKYKPACEITGVAILRTTRNTSPDGCLSLVNYLFPDTCVCILFMRSVGLIGMLPAFGLLWLKCRQPVSGTIMTRTAPENSNGKKFFIHTFGCQMNSADSERMAGVLENAGYECTTEASDAQARTADIGVPPNAS